MRAAVAILLAGLDAQQVVRGDLVQDPIERVFAAADLHPEQRAAGLAGELIEPPSKNLAVARHALQVLVGPSHLRLELVRRAGIEEERVHRGVGPRGFPADLHAELADVGPAARDVARHHAGAEEHERLAPIDHRQLLEQRTQHPEAGVALPFVVERRLADVQHETAPAGVVRHVTALSLGHRLEQRGFARLAGARRTAQIDDFRRSQVELGERQVPLPQDGRQAAADRRMIGRRTDLGSVGIGKETYCVGRRQAIDEGARGADHVTRRARVEAQTVDGDVDDAGQRRPDGRAGDRRGALNRRQARRAAALDELRGQHPAPAAVDRDGEFVGTKPHDRHAVPIADLDIDGDDVEAGSEGGGRLPGGVGLLARATKGRSPEHQHTDHSERERRVFRERADGVPDVARLIVQELEPPRHPDPARGFLRQRDVAEPVPRRRPRHERPNRFPHGPRRPRRHQTRRDRERDQAQGQHRLLLHRGDQ